VRRGPGRPAQRVADDDRGSALVELIWLSLILLIPLVYVLITLVVVQRSAYGTTEAARAAGRAYVLSPTPTTGRLRAVMAARVAMRDQGISLPATDVHIICHPTPQSCLRPGSTVEVVIRYDAALPLLPRFFGQHPATIAVSARHVEPYGSYRQGTP
jgi:hypothetical protein